MFRFLHTGDLHLDSPFVGISTDVPPAIGAILRDSTLTAWRRVVDLALEERVDFFLVAGDAFENSNRTLQGQVHFRDGLRRLADAGIPSVVVTGNHDHESGRIPAVTWPELAHRFSTSRVEAMPVVRDGQEIARIYGIGYRVRDVKDNLAARFSKDADAPFAVGLLHANVGGDLSAGNYAPCTLDDLRRSGMDYWALGHIHRHQVLSAERPTAVYCGNPQGRDPGETEPRGCYLVTVKDSGEILPEFKAVDEVRWQLLSVAIAGITTEEGIADAVTGAVDQARSTAERSVVARVTLTGRGPMHRELLQPGTLNGILQVSRENLGSASPFAWVESLRNATRPEMDIEARRQADDFLGGVLRLFATTRADLLASDAGGAGGGTADAAEGRAGGLDRVLDDLYANTRARSPLRAHRPHGADLVAVLDAAEALVVDRLADEG